MWAAVIIGLAALIQLLLAFQPLNFLIANVLPDDAFYYFQIARNIVAGDGSSFDGVNLTNGFHPLWLLINLPAFAWFPGELWPIQFLLLISVGLNLATALFLYRILSRFIESKWLKNFLLAVYLFNPFVLLETINGLETALSLFFITLFIWWWLEVSGRPTTRNFVIAGVVGGLMMLARLDNIFFFAAFLLWIVATGSAKLFPVREGKSQLVTISRFILCSSLVAVVVIFPWVIWNWLTFGMISTSAANTASLVTHGLVTQDNGGGWLVFVKTIVYMLELNWQTVSTMTSAPWFWIGTAGAIIYWWWQRSVKFNQSFFVQPLPFVLGGWLAMFIANAGLRWVGRSWYFVGFNLVAVILLAWWLGQAGKVDRSRLSLSVREQAVNFSRLALIPIVIFLLIFSYALDFKREILNRYQPQLAMVEAAEWGNENLPTGSVIGVFNAGVQGYLSRHRVVNLDGLVNNTAAAAIKDRQLWAYTQNEVGYFSDFPIYLDYRYRSFLGASNPLVDLDWLATVGTATELYGQTDGLQIFRLK